MVILYNNRLYLQNGDAMVGVDIDPYGITEVDGTEIEIPSENCRRIELFEAKAKFHIREDNPYKFPINRVDEIDIDELREKAKGLGVKYASRMGEEKLLESIAELEK